MTTSTRMIAVIVLAVSLFGASRQGEPERRSESARVLEPAQPAEPAQPSQPAEAAMTAPASGFLYKTLRIDQETYAYCVYVPPEYTREKAWPVILALHGSGERGEDGLLQTDVGIGRAIRRHRAWFPAIVIMPQCRSHQAWTGKMTQMALHCIEATSREYHLDAERVYLTGLSLGGQGTWLIGAEYPDKFAALVPICGFVEMNEATGLAAKVAQQVAHLPIWCFHGDADPAVAVQRTREMVAELHKVGNAVRYTEVKGGGHNVWDQAYDDPELWKWLLAQKRTSAAEAKP